MPTQFQKNPYVSCPYFYRETSMDIKCKDRGELAGGTGLVGESTVSCFASKLEKMDYMHDFCKDCYMGCEIYRAFEDIASYRHGGEGDEAR